MPNYPLRPVAINHLSSGVDAPATMNNQMNASVRNILIILLFVLTIVFIYYVLEELGFLSTLTDANRLKVWVSEMGASGPIAVVLLMAMAIVINPIPSAPIALAAGAAYGHTWGTVYVVVGATIGALIAFLIARLLGHELLQRYLGKRLELGWLGSQNILMSMVFISRLIPFLSFDLVSYGAGLTQIKIWRFTLATVSGLIPASFLLTHFGGELTSSNLDKAMFILLILGGLTLLPIGINKCMGWYRRRNPKHKKGLMQSTNSRG